jgi:hypothetical protein
MWSIAEYRYVFVAVGLIGVILFSVPSALLVVRLPSGEQFSELYVLGPGHLAEGYPFNVSAGGNYSVYLGVEDHLGSAAYYEVVLKFGNSSGLLPNTASGVASPLPALYRCEVFLTDGQAWEGALSFSFSDVTFGMNVSSVGRIQINGAWVNVNESALWDDVNNGYFYQVFAELWLYNATSNSFGFHNRFVSLWLNMTTGF